MINLIGTMPSAGAVLSEAGAHLHDYGKTPRAGRKLGHVTIVGADAETVQDRLRKLRSRLESWAV
jgi:5-(carboxyamino)imidazole ribonucleotide synthase